MLRVFILLTLLFTANSATAEKNFLNLKINSKLLTSSAVNITVGDVKALLEESFNGKNITLNGPAAELNITLELTKQQEFSTARVFPSSIFYPVQFYTWKSRPSKEGLALSLSSPSEMGLVFGLYGLLQEKLGFR